MNLPNPFQTGPAHPAAPDEAAASPLSTGTVDAAADRFVLDELRFVEALEPPPLFLQKKRISAHEIMPVLSVLAKY